MNFKYKYFITPNKKKRPLIKIKLRNGDTAFDTLALIDSGADYNLIHADLAQVLKLNLKGIEPIDVVGIGKGKFKAYQQVIDIGLKNYWFQSRFILQKEYQ